MGQRETMFKPSQLLFSDGRIIPSLHGMLSVVRQTDLAGWGIASAGVSQDGQHAERHKLHRRAGRSAAQHA